MQYVINQPEKKLFSSGMTVYIFLDCIELIKGQYSLNAGQIFT